jgi:hypothetical protein
VPTPEPFSAALSSEQAVERLAAVHQAASALMVVIREAFPELLDPEYWPETAALIDALEAVTV